MVYTLEQLVKLVETWLTTGELDVCMLADNFQFISPYWKSSSRAEFIEKFQNSTIYQNTSLKNIEKFDPIIKLISDDKEHFAIVLQYYTKNGSSVYETVLGTLKNGLLTELRSMYDLTETKKALDITG